MSSLIAKYHGPSDAPTVDLSMRLFVGQVPKSMDEDDVKPYFEKYGPVMSIKICRDRDSQQHKGCAFVTFDCLDDADNALHEMHDRVSLPGAKKEMQIKPVHADDTKKFEKRLFVGMISKSMKPEELQDMFSAFGEIEEANILYDKDKNSRGCGFLKFIKASSCMKAIKEMHHSKTLEGCNSPIVVKHADSPADKIKRQVSAMGDNNQNDKRMRYSESSAPPAFYNNQQQGYQQQGYQQQPHNQPTPSQPNTTAMALISAFTPLLNTLAVQNAPGTTGMLVKSIDIALNALQHEQSTQVHTALVSIASNLSVAVANNLNRNQASSYTPLSDQYSSHQHYSNQQQEYSHYSSTAYSAPEQSHHYNYSRHYPN